MTSTFEYRPRPMQCYNCQDIGHKAFQCKNVQKCAKCAAEGHRHSSCNQTVPKCVPCGDPHESFSRNCRKLYPSRHELNRPNPSTECEKAGSSAWQFNERRRDTGRSGTSDSGTPSEENSRPALDNPDGTSQMEQDGSLHLEGGPVGNPKHALSQ